MEKIYVVYTDIKSEMDMFFRSEKAAKEFAVGTILRKATAISEYLSESFLDNLIALAEAGKYDDIIHEWFEFGVDDVYVGDVAFIKATSPKERLQKQLKGLKGYKE